MLRELLSLFRSNEPIAKMGENFEKMLELARGLTARTGVLYFEGPPTPDERTDVFKTDVKINKLERRIRKQVIAHLTLGSDRGEVPYCIMLMSLVKDVERIGDYCKNLAGVYDDGGGPLPDDKNVAELKEVRLAVEETFDAVSEVFKQSDVESALDLIHRGREVNQRCDALIGRVARSPYDAATTTTLVLGTRYYKRLESHLLNVLSGVVMPLHKLDYYDEKSLPELGDEGEGGEGDETAAG